VFWTKNSQPMGYQDRYNPFRTFRPNWACRMKPTPDIARLPFKRRYQRQVRQGRRDRYAGPVRAVCGRARSQACREAAKALDEAAKMLDEAASLIEQTIRVKKDRGDVRCRDIETFS